MLQTANILLALGGDRGNTVPKYKVSAAEIALLRAIHGDEAVFDIEPLDEPAMEDGAVLSNRGELTRLRLVYDMAKVEGVRVVDTLYPGAAARVFETLDELEMPEELFKPLTHAKAIPAAPTRGSRKKAAAKPAPLPADDFDDGVKDMPGASGVLD